jgi:uncharacterized RDD family membrane protein YckC
MSKYSTFWARFWAGFIDGLIFSPISIATPYMSSPQRGPLVLICWTILSYSSFLVYSISMHAHSGQTVGKRLMKIRVMNVAEDRIPSLRQAFLREIGDVVTSIPGCVYTIYLIVAHQYSLSAIADSLFLSIVGYAGFAWFVIELITMFTNKKRRALHDLIAGTVVVHTAYDSVMTGLGLNSSATASSDCG